MTSRSETFRLTLDCGIFVVTVLLAVINGLQLRVMQQQLSSMEKTSRMDARAWIKVTHGETDINENRPLAMPIKLENVGKTPVRNLTGVVVVELLGKYDEPNFAEDSTVPRTAITIGSLAPNDQENPSYYLMSNKTGSPEHVLINASQLQSYKKGETYIATHGKLDYEDVFGHSHWVTFCGISAAATKAKEGGAMKCSNLIDPDGE